MTTQDKAMLWAVVATIGLFAFFWQWTHAEADAKRLARSLYDVCETLRYAYPEIMTDRDWPSPPADETEEFQRYLEEFQRYLQVDFRIQEHCDGDANAERLYDAEEAALKRARQRQSAK
jgi:hypothetical protein